MVPSSPTTGPPDRRTLRLLERQLADDPLVTGTEFDPDTYEPRLLHARIDADRYPDPVVDARLDVRWFESGDFSFHYVESRSGDDRWECRWDRHPNPHDPRDHVHLPPDGSEIESLPLPSTHPLDVYSVVLSAIERRLDDLWSADG